MTRCAQSMTTSFTIERHLRKSGYDYQFIYGNLLVNPNLERLFCCNDQ